jgi:glucose/arabinose dehydrogenase
MLPRAVAVTVIAVSTALLWGGGRIDAQSPLRVQVYATGFTSPVAFVQDPSDAATQFVVEQGGRIRAVRGGVVQGSDFINLASAISSGGERGLLGMAFAPDGRVFVNFTNSSGHTVIARFRRSANPLALDPSSRFDLRIGDGGEPFIRQPFSNHNGGHLAFGPDGFLYIGLGDGGSSNDPNHAAQTPGTLLGKMLRIAVAVADSHPVGYTVPPDNPFVNGPGRPEIWSYGLRNPWRYSFDSGPGGTGALILGDVGQGAWEEIDYEPRGRGGRNYGWRNREGAHDNVTSLPPAFLPLRDPIHELDRSLAQSITGGYVYRGTALGAAFQGRYFFGDFITSRVWSLALLVDGTGEARAGARTEHTGELGNAGAPRNVSSFGVDAAGELYIVSYSDGRVLKIATAGTPPSAPTGLRIIR